MPENFEPERYELREGPTHVFALDRRDFLGAVGAGLMIVAATPADAQRGGGGAGALESRLHIGEDGYITVFTGKVEEGQGALTELSMAAAEELGVPLDRVRMVMGDTDRSPNDGGTSGSSTTPRTLPQVRRAAAAARQYAFQYEGDREVVQLRGARVYRGDGKIDEAIEYGEAAADDPSISMYTSAKNCYIELPRLELQIAHRAPPLFRPPPLHLLLDAT
jgi:isoquinoline 1-oxidoreductase